MADDDVTLGELARLIRRVEEGQQAMQRDLNARMDRTVSSELYTVQHKATLDKIAELETDLGEVRQEARAADDKRVTDRRWWIAAVAVPVGLVLVDFVFPLLGGGAT